MIIFPAIRLTDAITAKRSCSESFLKWPQKKAIVIAGGVANFTDVKSTFKGIIQALNEVAEQLKAQGTKVFVRRGGPNEVEGLKLMEDFLKAKDLFGSVYGSKTLLTEAVSDAIEYISKDVGDNNA
jgi:ATP-citrate lyase beta-subunit